MKPFFIFLFLFVVSMSFVISYSAGEKLNLSYSNITNVTYPCLLINGSVYLSGNISLGDNSCDITFIDNVTEVIPVGSNSGGGGGGSKNSKCDANWNCTTWTACSINRTMTRECKDLNECNEEKPFVKRTCYFHIPKAEQPKIDTPTEGLVIAPPIEVANVTMEVFNDTTLVVSPPPKINYMLLFILISVIFVLIFYLAYLYTKDD